MVVDEGVVIIEDGMVLCRSRWEIYVQAHESMRVNIVVLVVEFEF